MNTQLENNNIEELLNEYFKDIDDKTFIGFIETFCYYEPNPIPKVSKLIEKFLKDNDLTEVYVKFVLDHTTPKDCFRRCSLAERDFIYSIETALLSRAFNRFRNQKEMKVTNKNFNFIKNQLLLIYERLNENEIYFEGKEEDNKVTKKVRNMKNV